VYRDTLYRWASARRVDCLADGWTRDEVHAFEEGDLPRRLWRVTQTLPR